MQKHRQGSARLEGFYRGGGRALHMMGATGLLLDGVEDGMENKINPNSLRQQRAHYRRSDAPMVSMDNVVKINQLHTRAKQLRFAPSKIHHFGLFAKEPIKDRDMVIEYVGELIRLRLADHREQQYERQGIGSSYLFRLDDQYAVDATRRGNIARFLNHSCEPNCVARIVSVGNEKRIVIYSNRDIQPGEELSYDYKFPIEDVKIPCFCGAVHCRGSLN